MAQDGTTVFYLRKFPKDVARRIRAAALIEDKKLTEYVTEVLRRHLEELERMGPLPWTSTSIETNEAWRSMRSKIGDDLRNLQAKRQGEEARHQRPKKKK